MRILLVYDCLYPNTVGGAELWLRALAERLGAEHDVVYLTRRQWDDPPDPPGFEVIGVSNGELYTPSGRRRLLPALAFAAGVFRHVVRRRGRYDLVHCLSYPYLSVPALRLGLAGRRPPFFVEWLECLSAGWWLAYAGPVGGMLGRALQRLCVRLTPAAFAFSDHTARRLREEGLRGELHRLPGLFAGSSVEGAERDESLVLFVGRHMPDKRPVAAVEAISWARRERQDLRGVIVGDGPERPRVVRRIAELGLDGAVEAPGFVERAEVERLLAGAACVVAPSLREGFGMTVLEAAAAGTPVVVCEAPDNAAAELVEPGVNGEVAAGGSAEEIGAAVLRVLEAGAGLRESAAAWFERNREQLSMERSIDAVERIYGRSSRAASTNAP